MNNTELRYKAETGFDASKWIETELLTKTVDSVMFEGMTGKEIREVIDYDITNNAGWGIFINQLPVEYSDGDDVSIPSIEYVKWLENEVERLSKNKQP